MKDSPGRGGAVDWVTFMALFCSSACSHAVYFPLGDFETNAIEFAVQSWTENGREVSRCNATDNLTIFYGSQAEVTHECGRPQSAPVLACSWSSRIAIAEYNDLGAPRMISDRTRASLLIHEFGHLYRRCWVAEDRSRLGVGADEDCSIPRADDPLHCDSELWNIPIQHRAMELWREGMEL